MQQWQNRAWNAGMILNEAHTRRKEQRRKSQARMHTVFMANYVPHQATVVSCNPLSLRISCTGFMTTGFNWAHWNQSCPQQPYFDHRASKLSEAVGKQSEDTEQTELLNLLTPHPQPRKLSQCPITVTTITTMPTTKTAQHTTLRDKVHRVCI